MDNEKLKPCPFCGGEAVVHTLGTGYIVECLECAVSTACENTKAEAIAAWNRHNCSEFPSSSVCVKQNGEKLDTNSVASNQLNTKLTYADIKKMVQPLEWKYISNLKAHYASTNKGMFFKIYKGNGDYILSIDGNNPVAFSEKLSKIKQAAQDFLVDLVAAALGVERSGE